MFVLTKKYSEHFKRISNISGSHLAASNQDISFPSPAIVGTSAV
jgi:hypothetical protein